MRQRAPGVSAPRIDSRKRGKSDDWNLVGYGKKALWLLPSGPILILIPVQLFRVAVAEL